MTWLRQNWLETLATGVTILLLACVYDVLAGYVAGPAKVSPPTSIARW